MSRFCRNPNRPHPQQWVEARSQAFTPTRLRPRMPRRGAIGVRGPGPRAAAWPRDPAAGARGEPAGGGTPPGGPPPRATPPRRVPAHDRRPAPVPQILGQSGRLVSQFRSGSDLGRPMVFWCKIRPLVAGHTQAHHSPSPPPAHPLRWLTPVHRNQGGFAGRKSKPCLCMSVHVATLVLLTCASPADPLGRDPVPCTSARPPPVPRGPRGGARLPRPQEPRAGPRPSPTCRAPCMQRT